jgi:manganese/iron transport system permease protein
MRCRVGTWIVPRRLAYLGDAMSHATAGGVATAYLAGVSITRGAIAAGLVIAALMGPLASHPRPREDARCDATLGGACILVVCALFGDLRAATFDPQHAALVGIRVDALRDALYALPAVSVVCS